MVHYMFIQEVLISMINSLLRSSFPRGVLLVLDDVWTRNVVERALTLDAFILVISRFESFGKVIKARNCILHINWCART